MAYSEPQAPVTRLVGIGFVVLLHAALIYALVAGLGYRVVEVVRAPIVTRIIEEARPPPPELPPPPPQLVLPPPTLLPPPEIHIEAPPPPPKSTAITVPVTPVAPPPPVAPPAPAAEPARVMPALDLKHSEEPEYPAMSRRLGEQGTAVLQVLVGVDGRALDAKLLQSSGFDRLDRAALASVKADYRFIAGTVDGKPQPMWFTFKFVWKLQ